MGSNKFEKTLLNHVKQVPLSQFALDFLIY